MNLTKPAAPITVRISSDVVMAFNPALPKSLPGWIYGDLIQAIWLFEICDLLQAGGIPAYTRKIRNVYPKNLRDLIVDRGTLTWRSDTESCDVIYTWTP